MSLRRSGGQKGTRYLTLTLLLDDRKKRLTSAVQDDVLYDDTLRAPNHPVEDILNMKNLLERRCRGIGFMYFVVLTTQQYQVFEIHIHYSSYRNCANGIQL